MQQYTVLVISDEQPASLLVTKDQLGNVIARVTGEELAIFEVTHGWYGQQTPDTVVRIFVDGHWEHHCQTHAVHAANLIQFLSGHPFSDEVPMVAIERYGTGRVIASSDPAMIGVPGVQFTAEPIPA